MPSYKFSEHLARVNKSPERAAQFNEESHRLDAAVALMKAREEAQLSQEELAQRSHVSRVTINRIEKGRISPSFRTLGTLAHAMGKELTVNIS